MTPLTHPNVSEELLSVKIETDNSNGWIDVYDFFGESISKFEFDKADGFVEFEIPQGEYYVYIRGDQSMFYSQVKISEEFNFTIKKLMLS